MVYLLYSAVGLGAGLLGAMLGVGGGVLMVPAFIFLVGLKAHDATATSMAVITFTALSATVSQYLTGSGSQIHWKVVVPVAVFAILGAFLGVALKNHVPADTLRKAFAVFLVLMAVYTWFK